VMATSRVRTSGRLVDVPETEIGTLLDSSNVHEP
jgi:hypothetical protein